ncbi:MAG: UDP-2,3-diacylglucosamine diphosphatase [Bacteriovoracaceae bacterium]|nr:UDP-2,3-diacylglucosamine diphosphatase [Bacteriovoracaceae bacterium]
MKIAMVSDVHIRQNLDEADKLLTCFFAHPLVQSSDEIYLLGDIFDLLVGKHREYFQKFPNFFDNLKQLVQKGKKIIFFEGNHDLHVKELFETFCADNGLDSERIKTCRNYHVLRIDNKSYYFSHGDEHDLEDKKYQLYKKTIHSAFVKQLAHKVISFGFLEFIGNKASKASRKVGSTYFNEAKVRAKFRAGAMEKAKNGYQYIIGGHSHVKDFYEHNGHCYVNNGYFGKEKSFIYLDTEKTEKILDFIKL